MSKIPRLSQDSEKQISSALAKVASLTNKGEPPNDAIVKVATAQKIPAGHVRLMVRAFNNGRSIGHIRDHDQLSEKAAAFALADTSEILERMFPSEVKTAAQHITDTAVADEYAMAPVGWLRRRAQVSQRASLVKSAAVRSEAESKAPAYPAPPERMGKQAVSGLADLRREHETATEAAIGAGYKVASAVNDVGEYFQRPGCRDINEVRVNARNALGRPGEKLVEHATRMVKIAHAEPERLSHAVNMTEAPYSLIKTALDNMIDFSEKRATLEAFEATLVEKRAEVLRPFGLCPETNVIVGSVWDNHSQTKHAGMLGLGMAGFMGGSARGLSEKVSPKSHEDLVQSKLQDLASPGHEDKLRSIRTQTMLHEMMSVDPVISGYDSSAVMEAYNHLSDVAPRAMQHRMMAQSLIRKYLEQASSHDMFDMDQMLDVESKLSDRDMPAQLTANQSTGASRELGPPISKPRGTAPPEQQNYIDSIFKPVK